jgi:hypothetical protein
MKTISQINLNYINNRISNEICHITINNLNDNILLDEYKKCKSVKNSVNKLTDVLQKHKISENKQKLVVNDYLSELIPAGTKGVIRGNKFNNIVKNIINNINLDKNKFEVCFEKQCEYLTATEIPDWYILEKSTKKIIIGMNQLSIFGGGQQSNRGSKYLIDNKLNTNNSKLLCVICNDIKFKKINKTFKLFEVGFKNNTLCYIKNLNNIINIFFNLV